MMKTNGETNELNIPRVMFAAMKSNSGKTLLTCGFLEALKKRGFTPVSYKCGPDYIDPMFHKRVLGIESENLDSFFCDGEDLKQIMSKNHDRLNVIEGVMGLYDGLSFEDDTASSYEIAKLTDTPIVLIADASGVGKTVVSQVLGVLFDDKRSLIKGIIFNRMSAAYYKKAGPYIKKRLEMAGRADVKCLGCVPKVKDIELDSRHLGLKLPHEIEGLKSQIEKVAEVISENCDLDLLTDIMSGAGKITVKKSNYPLRDIMSTNTNDNKKAAISVLAVAHDEAFCFYYRENLRQLQDRGLRIEFFSPLRDKKLPQNCRGILLGGGYPELYLDTLSKNVSMLDAVRDAIQNGMPSIAECGGFMYLHNSIEDMQNEPYKMVGVIDGTCHYSSRLIRFGYMQIESFNGESPSDFQKSVTGLKGHEFHYYESSSIMNSYKAKKVSDGTVYDCMISNENSIWGFPHFYYGCGSIMADIFVSAVKK